MKEYTVLSLYSKELKRDMRIFIMLPNSYPSTIKKYPVLYMHDGHNLFDDNTASYGKSWGIIEAYKNVPNLPELIIVGIDTAGNAYRNMDLVPFEFSFTTDEGLYGGNTDNYISFIIDTLKPVIDAKYRTFKNAKNTGIMGSSFGGVCSTYAALKYSDYFTKFGCVSNAYFVIQDQMESLAASSNLEHVKKLYMDVGTNESSSDIECKEYIESNQRIYDILREKMTPDKIKFEIVDGAIHNEKDWEVRFPEIIKFLFN